MTSSPAMRWMCRRWPSGGGRATSGTAGPPATPTRIPRPSGLGGATLSPAAARWDDALGEYLLDWEDVRESPDPHELALEFARSAFRHSCAVCEWDPELAATADGTLPPVG